MGALRAAYLVAAFMEMNRDVPRMRNDAWTDLRDQVYTLRDAYSEVPQRYMLGAPEGPLGYQRWMLGVEP